MNANTQNTPAPQTSGAAGVREKVILDVMKKSGWSREHTIEQIEDARKRLGVTYTGYNVNNFHLLTPEQQAEKYRQIVSAITQQKEQCITAAMEGAGWSREQAEQQIEDAKKRLGITYRDYDRYKFFNTPVEQQQARYRSILKRREAAAASAATVKSERESTIQKIMEKTGWDFQQASDKLDEARKRTGCSYKEYLVYKFYELDEAVQNDLFLVTHSQKMNTRYEVTSEVFKLLCDKELTNTCFSEYMRRPWCVNTKISLNDFKEKFAHSKRLIYKPRRGSRGQGVEAFDITPRTAKSVFLKLAALPEGVVEQYVVQHPAMSSLSPASVNTIRIVTVASNEHPVTQDGKMMDVAYAALRIGGGTSIVDNFHSGGMVAAIDLETGELVTHAADMDGNVFTKHPLTGTVIKGFKIPYFKEALAFVKDAHANGNVNGILGWDIAIAEDGPVLIEINLKPGVVLLTTPYIAEKKGMRHVMEKYL